MCKSRVSSPPFFLRTWIFPLEISRIRNMKVTCICFRQFRGCTLNLGNQEMKKNTMSYCTCCDPATVAHFHQKRLRLFQLCIRQRVEQWIK